MARCLVILIFRRAWKLIKDDLRFLLSLVMSMRMQACVDMADFQTIRRFVRLEEYLRCEIERFL